MGIKYISNLPSPEEIIAKYPLREDLKEKKKDFDKDIADVFTGKSDKFLAVIGPCSADNEDSVLDYVTRLAKVADEIKDKIIVIPRVYTNKPRTNGDGYKGLLHQPDPEKKPNVHEGLVAIRKMHLRVVEETGMFTADEMLYPDNLGYLDDVLSYIAVGARSVENQQHRLTSSGADVPVGMKNPTSGDMSVMLNAIYAAQQSHEFIYRNYEIKTDGNPLAHAILRGAVNKHGQCLPNYHYEDLKLLHDLYLERDIVNPAVIVDANKKYKEQVRIVKEVLHSMRYSDEIGKFVKGVMIESYIEEGNQKIEEHIYGKSITDPCLSFEDSKKLLLEMAEIL